MQRFSIWKLAHDYFTPPTLMRLVPISIVLVTGVILTTWTHRLLSVHRDLVVHTHEVIEMAKDVLIGLDDAETGQRGYLLSGDQRYLAPYRHARERLVWMGATLKGQVADNPAQTARFVTLSGLMRKKLDELQNAIDARDAHGFDAPLATELANTDQPTMDAIRHAIGDITEGEKSLLNAKDAEVRVDERRVQVVALLVGLASLLTRAGVEFYLTRRANGTAKAEAETSLASEGRLRASELSSISEPAPNAISPATSGCACASMPFMITNRQREHLRLLGFSDTAIREMTPADAGEHLRLSGQRGNKGASLTLT